MARLNVCLIHFRQHDNSAWTSKQSGTMDVGTSFTKESSVSGPADQAWTESRTALAQVGSRFRFKSFNHLTDLLRLVSIDHEQRVVGIDDHDVVESDRRDHTPRF